LLINNPANKNNAIDEKLWDNEINTALNKPELLNDNNDTNTKFKCNIDENAIIFFKSKYLKQEHVIIKHPINVNVSNSEIKNNNVAARYILRIKLISKNLICQN